MKIYKITQRCGTNDHYEPFEMEVAPTRYFLNAETAKIAFEDSFPSFVQESLRIGNEDTRAILAKIAEGYGKYSVNTLYDAYDVTYEYNRLRLSQDIDWAEIRLIVLETED